jgi:outer membrane lipoprotein carrier protein
MLGICQMPRWSRPMPRCLVAALVLAAAIEARPSTQPRTAARPDAQAFAQALQMRYQGIRDFSADFVHSYRGGVLRTETTERGTVTIKKPGRMRWVYTSPERKEFVSDGQKVYAYVPADKQVVVSPVASDDQGSTPALFLTGKGDIARDFTAS